MATIKYISTILKVKSVTTVLSANKDSMAPGDVCTVWTERRGAMAGDTATATAEIVGSLIHE